MCFNFDVEFVEANTGVGRRDLSRDGVHFRERAVSRLGSLLLRAISAALGLSCSERGSEGDSVCPMAMAPPHVLGVVLRGRKSKSVWRERGIHFNIWSLNRGFEELSSLY